MAGTILCGVNESAGARSAARVAGALSKRLELRLVLVHVADAFTVADGSAGNDESVTTMQARSGGKRLLDQLTAEQDLIGAEQRIEVGDPAERLAQVAAEERAALIVVGARAAAPMAADVAERSLTGHRSCDSLPRLRRPARLNRPSRDPLFLAVG